MNTFRWGIFGTGEISAKFVAGLSAARRSQAAFVASRSLKSAQTFASGLGIGRAIEGYAEAVREGGVDAVYIATPPAEHAKHALLCIEAGIPVLIEKPIASSVAEAQRIADVAHLRSVLAMEAMWTRFLPAAQAFKERVQSGLVGQPRLVSGSFGTSEVPDPASGNFDPVRGGGAIAHLGTYPLSLAQWLFGDPSFVNAKGVVGKTGIDEVASIQVEFANGVLGTFLTSIRSWLPNDFHVAGTEGMISFDGPIFRPHGLVVARQTPLERPTLDLSFKGRLKRRGIAHGVAQRMGLAGRNQGKTEHHFYRGNGYNYEADEVRICVERGKVESSVIPMSHSIAVLRVAERARAAIHALPDPGGGSR